LTVTVDGNLVLDGPRPQALPDLVKVGFTAATGLATDRHVVSNIDLGAPPPPPSLSFATAGVAHQLEAPESGVELTQADHDLVGAAWLDGDVSTAALDLSFDLSASGGSGGDGVALVLADAALPPVVGGGGSGLGASWLPASVIGFDTYQNDGDPASGFVFSTDFHLQPDLQRTTVSGQVSLHGSTRHVQVHVDGTRLTVTVDGNLVLDGPRPQALPDLVKVGFTAATGLATDRHVVSSVTVN
jgi:hypothetical protein